MGIYSKDDLYNLINEVDNCMRDIKSAISEKGVDVYEATRLSELADKIRAISQGGDYDTIYNALKGINAGDVKGSHSYFDGSVDVEGLKALGWTDDDIAYFRDNSLHYAWEDSDYVVSDENKALNGLNTRELYLATIDPDTYQRTNTVKFPPMSAITELTNESINGLVDAYSSLKSVIGYPTLYVTDPDFLGFMGDIYTMFNSNIGLIVAPRINNFHYVHSTERMFAGCSSLVSVPQYDTSNSSSFRGMFSSCKSLTTIPQLNTSNGTNFGAMFQDCSSLVSVPALDTSNGTNFLTIFGSCSKLKRIEGIDFSSATETITPFGTTAATAPTSLSRMIVNGSINASINFGRIPVLDFESMHSILTAASNTTNTNSKTMTWYNRTIKDQGGQLASLKAECESKGWQISGLSIS